jgi:hypothetical protein
MSIVESIRKIAEAEIRKLHTNEIGKVTSVFPHSSDSDKDNYECNVKLRDKEVELRKVPVLISHVGFANIPHVGDLVLISFINGDINSPVIIGRLYNDEDRPPLSKMEEIVYSPPYKKDEKLRRINIVLPEKILDLNFYDDRISLVIGKSTVDANSEGDIAIRSSKSDQGEDVSELFLNDNSMQASVKAGNILSSIKMNNEGYVKLQANPNGQVCELTMSAGGIEIATDSDIRIKAKANIKIECDGDFTLAAKGDISIQSIKEVSMQASSSLSMKSDALASVESTGPMTIKGAIVNIN